MPPQPARLDVILTLHAPILGSRSQAWADESACAASAAALAHRPPLRDAYVALQGPLGAGKTTFARHLLRALGVVGRIKSPTYAVLEPHEADGLAISHFDFYRFDDAGEWDDAGFRDVFARPGLKLVEWPEHAASSLPRADLRLTIEPLDAADAGATGPEVSVLAAPRRATFDALTPRGVVLLPG